VLTLIAGGVNLDAHPLLDGGVIAIIRAAGACVIRITVDFDL